ncbi:MAG: cobalt-precorrin-5B (C(1))-methyltransferase [Acidobacteriota bacterium]
MSDSTENPRRKTLRCGFSTGTAASAAAVAALRLLLAGEASDVVAVRMPSGIFMPIPVREIRLIDGGALATVIKDGGDDPDVTHRAEIQALVRVSRSGSSGIRLVGGEGVGTVTRAGLPVAMGEPAVNPVPREMLARNVSDELLRCGIPKNPGEGDILSRGACVVLPFTAPELSGICVEVEIRVPRGVELAAHTLNPRLGIVGGISILGTTGIVKPFSNKAYEETIQAAMSVAAANGCTRVVLGTGGKSEKLARDLLPGEPVEAFVQIADFFGFSVREARRMGFKAIVHSAFFGKVVKMAQGHDYTHAHRVALDLKPLADLARSRGYDEPFCEELAGANTARHGLELLLARGGMDVVETVSLQALEQSRRMAGEGISVRLLLFGFDGSLLADLGG